MILGIISDTHDNLDAIKRAVEIFNQREVGMVIHAGDFVAPFALNPFSGLKAPVCAVFGNCDGEKLNLVTAAKTLGITLSVAPYKLEFDGKKILIMHQPFELESLIISQCYDLIVYGHLHKKEIRRHGKTLVVNPGEGGGWISQVKTIAVVDLADLEAEIIEI